MIEENLKFWRNRVLKTENQFVMGIEQTLNYLAASRLKLGLLVDFSEDSLTHKGIVL